MAVIEARGRGYRARVRIKGFPPQSAAFERLTDARRWAQQTEAAIREGRHFKTSEAKKHTAAELIDRYIRDVIPTKKPNSRGTQKAQLVWWKKQIGSYLLCNVTPALLAECKDRLAFTDEERKVPRSPSTVVRYLAVLSHAFTMAVREYCWLDDNPMRRVTKPKEPRGRVRFLSDDERAHLLDACRSSRCPYLYAVVVLALSTGMRHGEIMNLRWSDVDLLKGRIILHDTKNGERRNVPLTGHAHHEMEKLSKVRRIDTALVFPNTNFGEKARPYEIRKSWNTALKKAEIEDFRFHDLRHSTASYLAMNGATLSEIAEVLGHKTLQMVKRYAHLSEAHTASVVRAMNDRLFRESGKGPTAAAS
jgi:integrase